MAYKVELAESARKQFADLDRDWQVRLSGFLDSLEALADPSVRFKRLHNELWGFWKHREGHVRLVAHIERRKLRVLLLKIGRRDDVYKVSKAELRRFTRDIET